MPKIEKPCRFEPPQDMWTAQKEPHVGKISFKRSGVASAVPLQFLSECDHVYKNEHSYHGQIQYSFFRMDIRNIRYPFCVWPVCLERAVE